MNKRASRTREHILEVASRLFYHHGIRAVGVDTIVAEAQVAKMTLYNHFKSKDDLVVAYLEREKEKWLGFANERRDLRGLASGKEHILGAFDTVSLMLQNPEFDFRGCPFINICAEIPDPDHPARKIASDFNDIMRKRIQGWAKEAGCAEYETVGNAILCLLYGTFSKSIMSGNETLAEDCKTGARFMLENCHEKTINPIGRNDYADR